MRTVLGMLLLTPTRVGAIQLLSAPRMLHLAAWHPPRRRSAGTAMETTVEPDRPQPKESESQFLIANSGNDVSVLKCPTPAVLQQGLLETAGLPQICIAGESNAGKSSLINHLLRKKSLARASSVAGKTRSVDMLLVNERVVVTDLPGLPSRDHQVADIWEHSWRPLVFNYMRNCDSLLAMVYVHDVRWKVSNLVREFLREVRETTGLPVILALTKDDKLADEVRDGRPLKDAEAYRQAEIALRQRLMGRIRKSLEFDGVHVHYSVNNDLPNSRRARRRLLRYVESIVEAGTREESEKLLRDIGDKHFADVL